MRNQPVAQTRTIPASPDLSVRYRVDVLVAGGGPAGIAAALAAARSGARVLLLENGGFLGGSATAAQVPAFCPFSDKKRAIVRGIGWEVLTEMLRRDDRPVPDPDDPAKARMDWVPIFPETLKCVYDDLCEAAGVRVLFHTVAAEVMSVVPPPPQPLSCAAGEGGGGTISHVLLANKDGLSLAEAAVFVDATGDGDLAARAGCAFDEGDENGETQGMTLCFTVAGGNRTRYLEYVNETGDGYLTQLIARAKAADDYDLPDASLVGMGFKTETVAGCNLGHVYGKRATNAESLSEAEREGRRVVQKLLPFLRRYVPGQEGLYLVSTGPRIGVRESRRIVGDYRLTVDDYLSCRTFPDDIARNAYFIDLHAASSETAARAKSISDAENERAARRHYELPPGESHGVPFRCLLPQGVRNLLVAGRCLSADRAVQGAVRVMPVCFALGEAAGVAAALAARDTGGDLRSIDVNAVQGRLR
ncbi:MAG: FAD-dependent oxidoreductase, partial [Akkermansiaceae bacterium]|nr:FAD-dependent oxidoreductase [Armatimonadota bacterium]